MQKSPERVLIDTNILLAVADGFPLFEQLADEYPHLEAVIMEGTLRELDQLGSGAGKQARAAKLARDLVERQHLNIVPQSVIHVDKALLAEARRKPAYIATQDRELQKRALSADVPVLGIQKRRLLRRVVS